MLYVAFATTGHKASRSAICNNSKAFLLKALNNCSRPLFECHRLLQEHLQPHQPSGKAGSVIVANALFIEAANFPQKIIPGACGAYRRKLQLETFGLVEESCVVEGNSPKTSVGMPALAGPLLHR